MGGAATVTRARGVVLVRGGVLGVAVVVSGVRGGPGDEPCSWLHRAVRVGVPELRAGRVGAVDKGVVVTTTAENNGAAAAAAASGGGACGGGRDGGRRGTGHFYAEHALLLRGGTYVDGWRSEKIIERQCEYERDRSIAWLIDWLNKLASRDYSVKSSFSFQFSAIWIKYVYQKIKICRLFQNVFETECSMCMLSCNAIPALSFSNWTIVNQATNRPVQW